MQVLVCEGDEAMQRGWYGDGRVMSIDIDDLAYIAMCQPLSPTPRLADNHVIARAESREYARTTYIAHSAFSHLKDIRRLAIASLARGVMLEDMLRAEHACTCSHTVK